MEVKYNYEGIENIDIRHNGIASELDDWEIDKFMQLKRDLAIISNPEKKNEIRHEMAILLGKENDETYRKTTNPVQQKERIEIQEEQAKEESQRQEEEILSIDMSFKPTTIDEVKAEYEKVNQELLKGNKNLKLFERYCELKQIAEELSPNIMEIDVSGAKEESTEVEALEESNQVNIEADEAIADFCMRAEPKPQPQQFTFEPLTPEEIEALLGDIPEQEDISGEVEVQNAEVEESMDEVEEGDSLPKEKGTVRVNYDLYNRCLEAKQEEEKTNKSGRVISWIRNVRKKLTGGEKKEAFTLNFEENKVIPDELTDVEDMPNLTDEVAHDKMIEEKEETPKAVDEKSEEKIEESKSNEKKEQEKSKDDPFQVLTDEQKKDMEARVAAMIVEMIEKEFQNGVSGNAFVREAENKIENEETANKGSFAGEMSKSESAEDLEQRRKEAIEKAELKQRVKQIIKENEILEYQGYHVKDLPSRRIVAELKLNDGKLRQKSGYGLVATMEGVILKVANDGSVTIGNYSEKSQNPFEVVKKEESQIGLGQRKRSAGMER